MKTSRIVFAIALAGVIGLISLVWWSVKNDQKRVAWEKKVEEQEKRKQDSLAKVQQEKTAAAKRLLHTSDSLINKHKYEAALVYCDSALAIDSSFVDAKLGRAKIFRLRKRYKEAIDEYTAAIYMHSRYPAGWYGRALCYVAQGKKKEAVADLRRAMDLNDPEAGKLYDKINPEKRRVVGSHCVCCDGSISYSSGRGTCSHHGGVCGTEYDYETYREY